jgi:hypothetical protein
VWAAQSIAGVILDFVTETSFDFDSKLRLKVNRIRECAGNVESDEDIVNACTGSYHPNEVRSVGLNRSSCIANLVPS